MGGCTVLRTVRGQRSEGRRRIATRVLHRIASSSGQPTMIASAVLAVAVAKFEDHHDRQLCSNPSTYVWLMIIAIGLFALIACIFLAKYFNLWIQAKMT